MVLSVPVTFCPVATVQSLYTVQVVDVKSQLPAIKPTANRLRQVNLSRKFGSIPNEVTDWFTTRSALRHSSLSVTAAVYVENRRRVAPDVGALLRPKSQKKKA
jgi:hypothetical protein